MTVAGGEARGEEVMTWTSGDTSGEHSGDRGMWGQLSTFTQWTTDCI